MNDLQNKQEPSLKKRLRAFGYAFQGIRTLFTSECHVRFHMLSGIVAIALGYSLGLSRMEWCCVIFAISILLACEAFNTAIEFLTDRISLEHHPLSGKAKDVAAAAVLFSAIGAATVGVIIFGPKIWNLFL